MSLLTELCPMDGNRVLQRCRTYGADLNQEMILQEGPTLPLCGSTHVSAFAAIEWRPSFGGLNVES